MMILRGKSREREKYGHGSRGGLKPGMTVLAKASSKLPDQTRSQSEVVRQKYVFMGPAGPENKNDCAGEGQQLFTRQKDRTRMRCMEYVACFMHAMNAHKPGSKGPLGRPRYRYETKNKVNPKETGSEVVNWVRLDPHRILLVVT
jgi:hypothetical protein